MASVSLVQITIDGYRVSQHIFPQLGDTGRKTTFVKGLEATLIRRIA
jgi:hypothetical protein